MMLRVLIAYSLAALSGCGDADQSVTIENATSEQYATRFRGDEMEMQVADRSVTDSCLRRLTGTSLPPSASKVEHSFSRGSGETHEVISFFVPDPRNRRVFLDSFTGSIRGVLKHHFDTAIKKDEDDDYSYDPHLHSVGGPPYWENDTFDAEKRYHFSYSFAGVHDDHVSLMIDLATGEIRLYFQEM